MDVSRVRVIGCLILTAFFSTSVFAQGPRILELKSQKIDRTTYFHVKFESPGDLALPRLDEVLSHRALSPQAARLPRLVPQDGRGEAVYFQFSGPGLVDDFFFDGPGKFGGRPYYGTKFPPITGLQFLGKVREGKEARFLLLYPSRPDPRAIKKEKFGVEAALARRGSWVEVPVTLDLSKGKALKEFPGGITRTLEEPPGEEDLEGRWATAQANFFGLLEAQAPDFGFYGLAREATGRRYNVQAPSFLPHRLDSFDGPPPVMVKGEDGPIFNHRLYELTTGTTAITESLALHRMRRLPKFDKEEKEDKEAPPEGRTEEVAKLPGIDIAEHPWEKMMAGKKPAPEPLAELVPHDNYYLHFKNYGKFMQMMDLAGELGTTLGRAFSIQSKDDRLKERIEQQLCLKNTGLGKLFGSTIVNSLAITGSDPYIREGSDITFLFRVNNVDLFLSGVNPHIEEAKKKWGKNLRLAPFEHNGVKVEGFTTPLREVSLYRAILKDVVVYSNSPAAVKRILDVRKGKLKKLSDALDFQYMRTVFRLDAPEEDAFLFLSDAFIRNLVGPALRIKERRRLEGLTSLYMVTHGALFTAWETGKLPGHHNEILARTGLKQEELFTPEGAGAFWDHERKAAFSDTYNTLLFATPLIELPIDKATPTEAREYENFRQGYLRLWRQFFDPIGMRFRLKGKELTWDTYVLPLIQAEGYNELRRLTGDGTIKVNPAMFGDTTVFQFLAHLSPKADERKTLEHLLSRLDRKIEGIDWLGNWFMLRLDDAPGLKKLVEVRIAHDLAPEAGFNWVEETRALFQLPFTLGAQINDGEALSKVMAALRGAVLKALPGALEWEPLKDHYRGATFTRVRVKGEGQIARLLGPETEPITPSLYYAIINSDWYLSLSEQPLKDMVDRLHARKDAKDGKNAEKEEEVNTVLYLAPGALKKGKDGLKLYLEYESHRQAQATSLLLYPFYRTGLINDKTPEPEQRDLLMRLLGFVPMSPEFAPITYDARTEDVVNKRHGSPRVPRLAGGVDADSPLGKLIEEVASVRVDMRFREDGLHATVTLRRK